MMSARCLPVGGASGADDVGAELTCEPGHHRTDCAGRAVREDTLSRLKAAVLEQRSAQVEGQLSSPEVKSRRMNFNDDIVCRCLRLGPLHQRHPGRSRPRVPR